LAVAEPTTSIRFNVLLPEPLDRALRAEAERQDRPLSRLVRQALEEYLQRTLADVPPIPTTPEEGVE